MLKKIPLAFLFLLLSGCTTVPSPSCTETLRLPAKAQNGVNQPLTIVQYCDDAVQDGDINPTHKDD